MVPVAFWAVLAVLFGLAFGSFLNVVIYRVPAGLSVVNPPSRCPRCGTQIRNRHNVPVLGWLMLRGRCYDCHLPISPRYPLVEAATGLLFGGVTAHVLHDRLGAALPAFLLLVLAAVTLGLVDLDHGHLPAVLLRTYGVLVVAALVAAAIATGQWHRLIQAGAGLVAGVVVGRALHALRPPTAPRDDAVLAGFLAATAGYLSWVALAVCVVVAAAAAVFANGRRGLVFGTWIAATALVVAVVPT